MKARKRHIITLYIVLLCLFVPKGMHAQSRVALGSTTLSSPIVSSIAEDETGNIWIGTNHGLNKYNGSNYIAFYASVDSFGLNDDDIAEIVFDDNRDLLLRNECGLCIKRGDRFFHNNSGFSYFYAMQDMDSTSVVVADRSGLSRISKEDFSIIDRMNDPRFYDGYLIAVDKTSQEVWTCYLNGETDVLSVTDKHLNILRRYKLPYRNGVSCLTLDRDGILWIAYHGGLVSCFDTRSRCLVEVPQQISDFVDGGNVLFLNCSRAGIVYLGVQGRGMMSYSKGSHPKQIFPEELLKEDAYIAFMDSRHNIWLSDKKNGMQFFSSRHLRSTLTAMLSVMNDTYIKNVYIDRYDHLWIRSTHDLLCCDTSSGVPIAKYGGHDYGHLYIDSKNRVWTVEDMVTVACYSTDNEGRLRLIRRFNFDDNVFSVSESADGTIWFTLSDRFACADGSFDISYRYAPKGVSFSRAYTQKDNGAMFLFSINNGVFEYGADGLFTPLASAAGNVNCVYKSRDNVFWTGSFNQGLGSYRPSDGDRSSYVGPKDGLLNTDIKSITQDDLGYIWGSTSDNVFRLDTDSATFLYVNDPHYATGVYSAGCVAKDRFGNLYFGGNGGGITVIHTHNVRSYGEVVVPLSVDVLVVNSEVMPVGRKTYDVRFDRNTISIWFSGTSFEHGPYLEYSYMMRGYDENWVMSYNNKRALYSKLPSGRYSFLVRTRIKGEHWSEPQELLNINIEPAPWNTWWAWTAYILLLAVLAYAVYRVVTVTRRRRAQIAALERDERFRHDQVNFLTNVSHEYKTPLSLIYGPLMQLLRSDNLTRSERSLLNLMKSNADRMKQLTEQILSVDSLDTRRLPEEKLKVQRVDIGDGVRQIVDNFRFIAADRHAVIEYTQDTGGHATVYADVDKVRKIMSNLLSNALKYAVSDTADNNVISVSLRITPDGKAVVRVADNGPGIPEDKADEIFRRYRRFSESDVEGSGIGLNYTAYLARLHKGSIAYSGADGSGAVFTLQIPVDRESYTDDEVADCDGNDFAATPAADIANVTDGAGEGRGRTGRSILIVEDNAGIRDYIRSLLAPDYDVTVANDGQEAMEMLQLRMPDMIVSDIVMPRKDGFALCAEVKHSGQYAHIPVVLLTAKSDLANRIHGLDSGADGYVSKPFDPAYLLAVIANLFANRERLQRRMLGLTSSSLKDEIEHGGISLNKGERTFIEAVQGQIDLHIADPDFSAKSMSEQLNISYSTLYSKVKSLTGQSPQNYISTYRLNKAMELLRARDRSVSEVGYDVGFSSVQYFSRAFKKHFGISPSAVR